MNTVASRDNDCFRKLAQGHLRTMLAAVERGKTKRNFNDNAFAV